MKKLIKYGAMILSVFMLLGSGFAMAETAPSLPMGGGLAVNGTIVVNGEMIDAPLAMVSGEGNVLIPLRAAAEALGLDVVWLDAEQSVIIAGRVQVWIGQTRHVSGDYFLGNFGPPPQLINGSTYIPITFFNYVLNGFSAIVENGEVVIDALPYFVYREYDNVVSASFNRAGATDALAYTVSTLDVGHKQTGEATFAFLRLPIGADLMANEVESARLHLRVLADYGVTSLNVSFITKPWSHAFLTLGDAMGIVHETVQKTELIIEDGWASLDITEFVVGWLSGDMINNGLALFPIQGENSISFDAEALIPYITVSGNIGSRPSGHAAFGFAPRIPDDLALTSDTFGGGNCLAFALRDYDPILMEHLGFTYEDLDSVYAQGGEAAVLAFVVKKIEVYVADNGEGLRISGFRRLDGFNSPISSQEYRIALRIKTEITEYVPSFNRRNFDFHLWKQIDDGRWSQKFPGSYSEIIVGTGYNIDPIDNPWYGARQWSMAVLQGSYTSDIVYFAVTKDTVEFTRHLGC